MKLELTTTKTWIAMAQNFLQSYVWLTDSFVLDFYRENHWEKLPKCWREFLVQLEPEELGIWLDVESTDTNRKCLTGKTITPLSLLAFKASIQLLMLKRRTSDNFLDKEVAKVHTMNGNECKSDCTAHNSSAEFSKVLSRHIKLKKRHEIENISKVICALCNATKTKEVLDVGAGLGHLSRCLTYGCGLKLTCVDCVEEYGTSATKLDTKLKNSFAKTNTNTDDSVLPIHKCLKLEMNRQDMYLKNLTTNFGIIGLHTCGNLGPVILHNFVNSPAKFFVSVGCCYMKLNSTGFPLSDFCKKRIVSASFESLEVACHAVENYCKRLRDGFVEKLKIHSYRATLETILVSRFKIFRAGLRGVPHSETMPFSEYAKEAVKNLGVTLLEEDLYNENLTPMLRDWYKVVLFYSLRLLVAAVVETIVLLDRGLFIIESCSNCDVRILPVFHPEISPRNFVVFGTRNDKN